MKRATEDYPILCGLYLSGEYTCGSILQGSRWRETEKFAYGSMEYVLMMPKELG